MEKEPFFSPSESSVPENIPTEMQEEFDKLNIEEIPGEIFDISQIDIEKFKEHKRAIEYLVE